MCKGGITSNPEGRSSSQPLIAEGTHVNRLFYSEVEYSGSKGRRESSFKVGEEVSS
jgi:hypothetical protein